ncbi:MAG TPA: NAD(P)-binding domain-containing protein [Devosia sp.]|uniref:NADPH-dependent F420 reductase n=1 Tax=Devosia sp. TaxID=1871048 RepID=UPI002F93B859
MRRPTIAGDTFNCRAARAKLPSLAARAKVRRSSRSAIRYLYAIENRQFNQFSSLPGGCIDQSLAQQETDMTTTAIIGLGNMGKGIAKRFAGKTKLVLASRDQDATRAFAATLPAGPEVLDIPAAVAQADVIVLALPFAAAKDFVLEHQLAGKILVDISNPITPDFSGLTIGHTTSAAEELQSAAPAARVVKAFNTIFASLFDLPAAATVATPVFLAGNDEAAVAAVEQLVAAAGFAVEKTGTLDAARLLEPLGMLNIRFGYGLGKGTSIAPAWQTL